MMCRNGGSILATATLAVLLQAMPSTRTAAQELFDREQYPPMYTKVMGRCTFANERTGETCMEFRGGGWTLEYMELDASNSVPVGRNRTYMEERCAREREGVLDEGEEGCPTSPSEAFAGFCLAIDSLGVPITPEFGLAMQATAMTIAPAKDCSFNKRICGGDWGGYFEASPACGGGGSDADKTEDDTGAILRDGVQN